MMEGRICRAEDIGDKVNRQIKRNGGLRSFAIVRLPEPSGVLGLAEQHPHGRHRGGARAEMNIQFKPLLPIGRSDGRELRVCNGEDTLVIHGAANRDGVDGRVAPEPFLVLLRDPRRVIAQQMNMRGQFKDAADQGTNGAIHGGRLAAVLGKIVEDPPLPLRRQVLCHRSQIRVPDPSHQYMCVGHDRSICTITKGIIQGVWEHRTSHLPRATIARNNLARTLH